MGTQEVVATGMQEVVAKGMQEDVRPNATLSSNSVAVLASDLLWTMCQWSTTRLVEGVFLLGAVGAEETQVAATGMQVDVRPNATLSVFLVGAVGAEETQGADETQGAEETQVVATGMQVDVRPNATLSVFLVGAVGA